MTITVYVGDVTEYLGAQAKIADNTAQLITQDNYQNLKLGTYYVSIGDLNSDNELINILFQADNIIYAPPDVWTSSDMKLYTERTLAFITGIKKVENFILPRADNLDSMVALIDSRKSSKEQLWVAGCSITAGVGVDPTQRYGQLLSDQLNLPVSFLAKHGSSILWQADQILRSDIQKNDIVVWGITSNSRFPYFIDNEILHLRATNFDTSKVKNILSIDSFSSQDLLYRNVASIYQVINFCKQVNAKLILANLFNQDILPYISNVPEFINLFMISPRGINYAWLDLGTDDIHPGPIQHNFYSEQLLNKINNLYT